MCFFSPVIFYRHSKRVFKQATRNKQTDVMLSNGNLQTRSSESAQHECSWWSSFEKKMLHGSTQDQEEKVVSYFVDVKDMYFYYICSRLNVIISFFLRTSEEPAHSDNLLEPTNCLPGRGGTMVSWILVYCTVFV